ncbi:MAG: uracil phosphoribosyltransferase [Polyangiaceae bacterium]
MTESAYAKSRYRPPEIDHRYGPNVRLLDDPVGWTQLARLCARDTQQPEIGRLVRVLYSHLAHVVMAAELPRARLDVPTRMVTSSPEAVLRSTAIARETRAVTVGIARAGTLPSQVVYDLLNDILDPTCVRQDHLFMSRTTDANGRVTGTAWHDAKIGRDVEGRIVLFPDPMGATGSTIVSALDHYKGRLDGVPARCIAVHLIVTPEYIRNVLRAHPDTIVYALRVDRGLSAPEVLATVPGTRWDDERGLDDHQYIVPGAGGIGEILNNAWV